MESSFAKDSSYVVSCSLLRGGVIARMSAALRSSVRELMSRSPEYRGLTVRSGFGFDSAFRGFFGYPQPHILAVAEP